MKKELWVITYDHVDNEYMSTGIKGVFIGNKEEVLAYCKELNSKSDSLIYGFVIARLLNGKKKSCKFITWLRDWLATICVKLDKKTCDSIANFDPSELVSEEQLNW